VASKRDLEKRLGRLEGSFPLPPTPVSELPIEEWTEAFMEGYAPPKGLYDEDFFPWHEELGRSLASELHRRIAEAWGLDWLTARLGLSEAECDEILQRAGPLVPAYIERYWQQWQADKPERDREIAGRARIAASLGYYDVPPNNDTPQMIRRRMDAIEAKPPQERLGYDWWIAYHRERAELAERYAGWEPEDFLPLFEEWRGERADG